MGKSWGEDLSSLGGQRMPGFNRYYPQYYELPAAAAKPTTTSEQRTAPSAGLTWWYCIQLTYALYRIGCAITFELPFAAGCDNAATGVFRRTSMCAFHRDLLQWPAAEWYFNHDTVFSARHLEMRALVGVAGLMSFPLALMLLSGSSAATARLASAYTGLLFVCLAAWFTSLASWNAVISVMVVHGVDLMFAPALLFTQDNVTAHADAPVDAAVTKKPPALEVTQPKLKGIKKSSGKAEAVANGTVKQTKLVSTVHGETSGDAVLQRLDSQERQIALLTAAITQLTTVVNQPLIINRLDQ